MDHFGISQQGKYIDSSTFGRVDGKRAPKLVKTWGKGWENGWENGVK